MVTATHKFEYKYMPIRDLALKTEEDQKTGKPVVQGVIVDDERHDVTERFWTSMFARYGFNKAFFRFFNHEEVFNRISEVESADRMRLCIERDANGKSRLLGVSSPTKAIVPYDELVGTLERFGGDKINYHNGVVESMHTPRAGQNNFDIAGDIMSNRFVMSAPIDGYGQPSIYLSLMRQICTNGMIGYSKAFRSSLALGKGADDATTQITRALDTYGNDEGFAAIRQRVEAATQSWASVHETEELYKLLIRLHGRKQIIGADDPELAHGAALCKFARQKQRMVGESEDSVIGTPLLSAFHSMTGDTSMLYGLANLDSLSVKRKRTLPVKCTVYDVINFATEVATHYSAPEASRGLQAHVGTLISEEYDMEGTKDRFGEFADFHVTAKLATPELTGSK
jgi:hypothetical protein